MANKKPKKAKEPQQITLPDGNVLTREVKGKGKNKQAGWRDARSGQLYDKTQAQNLAAGRPARTGFLNSSMPILNKETFGSAQGLTYGQQGMNEYNAQLSNVYNRPNEYGVFGQQEYEVGPDGRVTIRRGLSGNQQQINTGREQADISMGGIANQALGRAQQDMSQPYDISGAPAMPGQQGLEDWRNQAEQAEYQNYMRRMQPEFQQQQNALQQQLADQGLTPGSARYDYEMKRLAQQQSDAQLQAQSMARQTFTGQMGAQQQLGQNAREQYISDMERRRYSGLNEAGAALGNQRGVVQEGYNPMAALNFQSPDVAGTGLGWRGQDTQVKIAKIGAAAVPEMGGGGGGSDPYAGYGSYLQLYGNGGGSGGGGNNSAGQIVSGIGQGVGQGIIGASVAGKSKRTGFLY